MDGVDWVRVILRVTRLVGAGVDVVDGRGLVLFLFLEDPDVDAPALFLVVLGDILFLIISITI